MTINQLIKKLEKLRDEHGKTIRVCADTDSLRRSCNEAWTTIEIYDAEFDVIAMVDGDGGEQYTKRGNLVTQRCIVLR